MSRFDAPTEQLLAAAIAGVATPDQLAELNALLAEDDALLDEYVRLMRTDAALFFQHGHVVAPEIPAQAPKPDAKPRRDVAVAGRIAPIALSLAAALALTAAVVAIYVFATNPESPTPNPFSPPIATLIDATGTVLANEDIANPGGDYAAGAFAIESGSAEFLLANRVTASLNGKTRLSLRDPLFATLEHGSVRFHCPAGTEGFTVETPGGIRVVDLGTDFLVRHDQRDGSRVEVHEGRVRLEGAGGDPLELDPNLRAEIALHTTRLFRTLAAIDIGSDSERTAPGYRSIEPRDDASVEIDGVTFTMFGSVDGRDRPDVESPLLGDFALRRGDTSGGAVGVRIAGLRPGTYRVRSWHDDGTTPTEPLMMQLSIRHRDAATGRMTTTDLIQHPIGPDPAEFDIQIESDVAHELLFREANARSRARLNALRIEQLERSIDRSAPIPHTHPTD